MRALGLLGLFFFSSRRRHTRLQGDWSSDVCSSDLEADLRRGALGDARPQLIALLVDEIHRAALRVDDLRAEVDQTAQIGLTVTLHREIGRASCRERV